MAKPILLFNVIHSEAARDFTEKILSIPSDKPIDILINSPGGSLSAGWSMLAALQDRKVVNMKVVGDASSMAFFFLLFATNVTAFDTSTFLIHRAANLDESEMSENDLKDLENRNKVIRKKLEARIHEDKFKEVTGKTFDDIFSMDGQLDVSLNAEEAKEIGLINEVISLDTKELEKIEAEYFDKIAALTTPQKKENSNNNNSNNNNMGLFSKDPVYLGVIGESQFAYNKLEVKAKIKAIGDGEKEPITGTFEANDKKVTVVADIITAIEDIDTKQEQITALESKVEELTALVAEAVKKEPIKKVETDTSKEQITALEVRIEALTKTLTDAKLNVSKPGLPEGEFKENEVIEAQDEKSKGRKIQKSINAQAKEVADAVSKAQNNREV